MLHVSWHIPTVLPSPPPLQNARLTADAEVVKMEAEMKLLHAQLTKLVGGDRGCVLGVYYVSSTRCVVVW